MLVLFDTSMIERKFETSKSISRISPIFELLIRYAGVYARDIIGVEKKLKKVFWRLKTCKIKVIKWIGYLIYLKNLYIMMGEKIHKNAKKLDIIIGNSTLEYLYISTIH